MYCSFIMCVKIEWIINRMYRISISVSRFNCLTIWLFMPWREVDFKKVLPPGATLSSILSIYPFGLPIGLWRSSGFHFGTSFIRPPSFPRATWPDYCRCKVWRWHWPLRFLLCHLISSCPFLRSQVWMLPQLFALIWIVTSHDNIEKEKPLHMLSIHLY